MGVYDFIKNNGKYPFHMPGHKRSVAFEQLAELGAWADITEIHGADDLHAPCGAIAELMIKIAHRWGSKKSYISANGSTCGNLAAMGTLGKRGDKVLVARNCHRSVYHGLELFGYRPVFVTPDYVEALGVYGSLAPDTVAKVLADNGDAAFLVMTSPTYEGAISDIKTIASLCKAAGVKLLVDEAHGAHLNLSPCFSGSAVGSADITVQSLHKTLPALTPAALLHIDGDGVDRQRLEHYLRVFQTSSPSFPLIASVELCADTVRECLFDCWAQNIESFKKTVKALKGIKLWEGADTGVFAKDPSKLVLTGKNGFALAKYLRNKGIETEYATDSFLLAMTGAGDSKEGFCALAEALKTADALLPDYTATTEKATFCDTPLELDIETALTAPATPVPLEEAAGLIAAEYVWAYPPGIPLLVPGQRISAEFAASKPIGAYSDKNALPLVAVLK